MTTHPGALAPGLAPDAGGRVWHTLSAEGDLGLQQEGKTTAAVTALQKMMIIKAKVRRDGQLRSRAPARRLATGPTWST